MIVVESPTKVKTLQKFLGDDYVIKASVGHVKDLPEGELGVDIEKDFQPQYVTIAGKKKVLGELKKASRKVKNIYLGPDSGSSGGISGQPHPLGEGATGVERRPCTIRCRSNHLREGKGD